MQCPRCRLVFVPPGFHLSPEAEQAEYDLHQNSPDDPGYRQFLSRLADPLLQRLKPNSRGLDFGCGPGPALASMLKAAGQSMVMYDPFYVPDASALQQRYDFITATEVLEHLRRPGRELTMLWRLLKENGRLAVMTKQVKSREAFATWHYKNDPTHISFFSRETFNWLAGQWQAGIEFFGADVVIFEKLGLR